MLHPLQPRPLFRAADLVVRIAGLSQPPGSLMDSGARVLWLAADARDVVTDVKVAQ